MTPHDALSDRFEPVLDAAQRLAESRVTLPDNIEDPVGVFAGKTAVSYNALADLRKHVLEFGAWIPEYRRMQSPELDGDYATD